MPLANEKEVQVPVPSKTGEKESYLPSELFQCSVQMKFIDNCLDLAFAVTTVDLSTVVCRLSAVKSTILSQQPTGYGLLTFPSRKQIR